eukprot:400183_1
MDAHTHSYLLGHLSQNWNRVSSVVYNKFIKALPATPLIQYSLPSKGAFSENEKTQLPILIEQGKLLKNAGVTHLMIACGTSHQFRDEIMTKTGLFMFDMVNQTKNMIVECMEKKGYQYIPKVGLLATVPSVTSGIYKANNNEYQIVTPNNMNQKTLMKQIYLGKKITSNYFDEKLIPVIKELIDANVNCIVLGCTDIGSMLHEFTIQDYFNTYYDIPIIDCNDALILDVKRFVHQNKSKL